MRKYLLTFIAFLAIGTLGAFSVIGITTAWAQTTNSLQVGSFTISVPATNPAVTVNSPPKSGTLALTSDIPITPPGTAVFAGQITVNGSATFNGITGAPVCSLTPRFTTTATGLQITVIDYVCTAKNN